MIKKGNPGDGFLLCFLLNLLFNFWWGAIATLLLIFSFVFRISIIWSFIGYFVWISVAFLGTALILWATGVGNEPTPVRPNLNPYSAKNSDVFPTVPNESVEDVLESKNDEGVNEDAGDSIDNVEESDSREPVE